MTGEQLQAKCEEGQSLLMQMDYLRAESDLLETRAALVTARHARTAALVELARVTGELSPQWLTQNLEIRR